MPTVVILLMSQLLLNRGGDAGFGRGGDAGFGRGGDAGFDRGGDADFGLVVVTCVGALSVDAVIPPCIISRQSSVLPLDLFFENKLSC